MGPLGPLPWKALGHILKSWTMTQAHHKSEGLSVMGESEVGQIEVITFVELQSLLHLRGSSGDKGRSYLK